MFKITNYYRKMTKQKYNSENVVDKHSVLNNIIIYNALKYYIAVLHAAIVKDIMK